MGKVVTLAFLLGALAVELLQASLFNNRTVSSSGAFVVYAESPALRGKISREAERVHDGWMRVIDQPVRASAPIVIQDRSGEVRPKGMPATKITVFDIEGGGTKIQLDLWDKKATGGDALALEVCRALVIHAMRREKLSAGGASIDPPPEWLVEGVAESLRGSDGEVPSGIHAALLRSDRPPSLNRFLRERPEIMDSRSLILYRAQAYALLEVLRKASEPKRRMAEFLAGNPHKAGVEELLAAFSLGKSESELNKLWTLSIARSSMPQRHSSLGVRATNEALEVLMDVPAPPDAKSPDGLEVRGAHALPALAKVRGGSQVMRELALECILLEFRAHPLMKPFIAEYRRIFMTLERKPKAKIAAEIEELEALRALLLERHGAILDYMNWYEATQLDEEGKSPLAEIPELPEIPQRRDPLTRELDRMEALGW